MERYPWSFAMAIRNNISIPGVDDDLDVLVEKIAVYNLQFHQYASILIIVANQITGLSVNGSWIALIFLIPFRQINAHKCQIKIL